MGKNDTPWDIYVDERKVKDGYALGFLIVPNTASFLHKLHKARHASPRSADGKFISREIHWNSPHLDCVRVAINWIDCVFQHNGAKFFLYSWPYGETKQMVILRFLRAFCRTKKLQPPYNVVVFLDFDSDHAKAMIQNNIREVGAIARCYHLDSKNNDCLQCCDLLLGALARIGDEPTLRLKYEGLKAKIESNGKTPDSEVKQFLAAHLGFRIDGNGTSAYDRRIKSTDKTSDT